MIQDEIPRHLQERTGRHHCTQCLREIAAADFFGNDFLCSECARAEFPFASTPGEAEERSPESTEPDRPGDED